MLNILGRLHLYFTNSSILSAISLGQVSKIMEIFGHIEQFAKNLDSQVVLQTNVVFFVLFFLESVFNYLFCLLLLFLQICAYLKALKSCFFKIFMELYLF